MLFSEWLQERYSEDEKARSKKIEKDVVSFVEGIDQTINELHLLDIGSGLGANLLYYSENLPFNQNWILLDKDEKLLNISEKYITNNLVNKGWTSKKPLQDTMTFTKNGIIIKFALKNGSLLELDELIDLQMIDIITANAVFDLLSFNHFTNFVKVIKEYHLPLLSTLNYHSMVFRPTTPVDSKFIELYESHMTRKQEFGKAMGPNCSNLMSVSLQKDGYRLSKEESNWKISRNNTKILSHILTFMKDSMLEILEETTNLENFSEWVKQKTRMIDNKSLSLQINHFDIFAHLA